MWPSVKLQHIHSINSNFIGLGVYDRVWETQVWEEVWEGSSDPRPHIWVQEFTRKVKIFG